MSRQCRTINEMVNTKIFPLLFLRLVWPELCKLTMSFLSFFLRIVHTLRIGAKMMKHVQVLPLITDRDRSK